MNGILSSAPACRAARLLVGTQMLCLVQAVLLMRDTQITGHPRIIVLMTGCLVLAALILAIRGETTGSSDPWWKRRHAH